MMYSTKINIKQRKFVKMNTTFTGIQKQIQSSEQPSTLNLVESERTSPETRG